MGGSDAMYLPVRVPRDASVGVLLEETASKLDVKDVSSLQLRLVAHEGAVKPTKEAEHATREKDVLDTTLPLAAVGVKEGSWLLVQGGCPKSLVPVASNLALLHSPLLPVLDILQRPFH